VAGLDEQRPDPAEEGGGIADDFPGRRAGTEEPRIAPVRQRVGEGIVGVLEQAGGVGNDPVPVAIDDRHGHERHGGTDGFATGIAPAPPGDGALA
jgi:hypothetical protein